MIENNCGGIAADPFHCPTKYELWRSLLALLPRGRAWQTAQDVSDVIYSPGNSQAGTFETGVTSLGKEPSFERLTVLQQFWLAFAEVLEFLHSRACALIPEMFCSTMRELREEWWEEYGYPDDCDPWQSLCDKVTAVGGSNCEYISGLAASRGWSVKCSDCDPTAGAHAGCSHAGASRTCGCVQNVIYLIVRLDLSPSYSAPPSRSAFAGAARAGSSISSHCPPGADKLECLIERSSPRTSKRYTSIRGYNSMVNIFGPGHYGTTEEVADRPTPIATGKGFDAWFGQCNPDGTGGTAIDEQWLNLILAALRRSARSAGATENELSDDMLSEALSRYASGGIQYVDSGAANAYVLSTPNLFIMPKTYFKGMMIFFTPANPNNAASQVTVYSDGNPIPGGAKPILDQTGAALTGGELSSNLTGAHYDPALNGGNGAFKLFPWANAKTAHGYIGRRVFDSDAIYVPTPGTRRVRVKVIGGGAKGGDISAAASTQFAAAGGGGSGGEAESELASGYAGAAITIGLGGTTATPDGGTTSFGALLSATGGHSPLPLSPGTISQIQTGGAPGSGTGGNIRNSKGTSGLPGIAFSNTNEVSGAGAPSSDGPGGGSVFTSSSNGNDGAGYGTGGSGAVIQSGGSPVVGGKGKSGVVIIDEYSWMAVRHQAPQRLMIKSERTRGSFRDDT